MVHNSECTMTISDFRRRFRAVRKRCNFRLGAESDLSISEGIVVDTIHRKRSKPRGSWGGIWKRRFLFDSEAGVMPTSFGPFLDVSRVMWHSVSFVTIQTLFTGNSPRDMAVCDPQLISNPKAWRILPRESETSTRNIIS